MLVFEAKLKGKPEQFKQIDQAIRTGQFVRNSCLRYWEDNRGVGKNDLQKYCAVLAKKSEFPWAAKLNSMARQAHAARVWNAISRFFENCRNQVPGKKGYPRYKKHSRSVEYKTTGWKLSNDRKYLTLTDGFKAGKFKLLGTRDLTWYTKEQIKRVRIVKRADGYYAQFCLNFERLEKAEFTGSQIGVDVGLNAFYTDSNGNKIDNRRYLRQSEKRLKRIQRKMSRRYSHPGKGKKNQKMVKTRVKQSQRYHAARKSVARAHLRVSRQRKDHATKLARCVIQSNDLVAYENLKVRNMVKNHCLAKSISDAGWSMFTDWLDYFAKIMGKVVVAVPPHYTSQNCSNCGATVKKSLSVRVHKCPECGTSLDRDENAALNILMKALGALGVDTTTVGHTESNAQEENDRCFVGESLHGKSAR